MILGILVGVIPLVILIVLIGAIISSRGRGKTGGVDHEDTERGNLMIRVIYTYVILFATLMMTIGGSVGAFMAIADLVAPPAYYQTFEDYRRNINGIEGKQLPAPTVGESEEVLKKNYNQAVADDKMRAQERAKNSLIKSFGWIIIPLPVFLYFQRRLKKE